MEMEIKGNTTNPETRFRLDELIEEEFYSTRERKLLAPETELMLAVLKDGIAHILKGGERRKRKREAQEVAQDQRWMIEENDDWVFSFENICTALQINPSWLRRGIIQKKKAKLKKRYINGRR